MSNPSQFQHYTTDLIKTLTDKQIFQNHASPITLKSGKTTTFYADFRKLYTEPALLNKIASQIAPLIPTNYIAGSPLGAIRFINEYKMI